VAPRGFFLAEGVQRIIQIKMRTPILIAVVMLCVTTASTRPGFAAEPPNVAKHASNGDVGQPPPEVTLQVYKKWIGAAGDEADVEIDLSCPQSEDFPSRFINQDRPGGWDISYVPEGGIFCSVLEVEEESFVGDVEDCRELLVLPGQDVECTIVNTKVVKRIDMLNRYGLFMMIAVMLGAGLAAVRRFAPF
jgi:hypothetical protein